MGTEIQVGWEGSIDGLEAIIMSTFLSLGQQVYCCIMYDFCVKHYILILPNVSVGREI